MEVISNGKKGGLPMYAQAVIKQNSLLRNSAYGIVMRGVQKCTCAGASLRNKKYTPLNCITIDMVTDPACGSDGMFCQSARFVKEYQGNVNDISIYGGYHKGNCYENVRLWGVDRNG